MAIQLREFTGWEGAKRNALPAQDGGHAILNWPIKLRKFAELELLIEG
jgi:hypothetical protein